jgi:hypothetical protein
MEIVELRLKKGNTKDVLEKLPKEYFWRFYKDSLNQVFFIYTYFDDRGFQYDTLIPIYAKNQKTLKIRICKTYLEKFMSNSSLFDYVIEDITNYITEYIKDMDDIELE